MLGNSQYLGSWKDASVNLDLNSYKHYSFDFWNTIASSNPKFKNIRAEYIFNIINSSSSTIDINLAFEKVGRTYNRMVESGEVVVPPIELYRQVLTELNFDGDILMNQLVSDLDDFFLQYPPLLDIDFIEFIDKIKLLENTTSVTSNTAFISGAIIKKYLDSIGLYEKFDFFLFSDEIGSAKPNELIFVELIHKAQKLNSGISSRQILHFGDNFITDYNGAINFGISAFLLSKNNEYQYPRFSLHCITNENLLPFSKEEYSQFKYGDLSYAQKFGSDLFDYFLSEQLVVNLSDYDNIIIYSSPYAYIPTSSYYLADFFYKSLIDYMSNYTELNTKVIWGKINRCQTYSEDYGSLNAEQRYDLIKNDTYELETMPSENDLCIFIDDISITGTHQKVVEKILNENRLLPKCMFLYYAILINNTISPTFENTLNYAYVNGIERLINVIKSESFGITTRTIKYILSLNRYHFIRLLDEVTISSYYSFWEELTSMAKLNGYNDIEVYSENFNFLQSLFLENQITK
jgi:FMN phosphatase YigB (HAD superfamily)